MHKRNSKGSLTVSHRVIRDNDFPQKSINNSLNNI